MTRASGILVRSGALLAVGSFFLPQFDSGGIDWSPFLMFFADNAFVWWTNILQLIAWFAAPVWVGILLLVAFWRGDSAGPFVRAACQVALLAAAFAMATTGSILMSSSESFASDREISFALCLLMFIVPVACGGVALARLVGGANPAVSAGFARAALGLLLLLDGLFLMEFLDPPAASLLVGRLVLPLAGALVALGETLALVSRAAPVSDPLAASS